MKTIRLFNPLENDFEYEWYDDLDGKKTTIIPSLTTVELPKNIGVMIAQHLADKVYQETMPISQDRDISYQTIYDQIIVSDINDD